MSVEERIVDILSKHPEGLTITNISKELNIHRNTTSKYIFALAKAGIIEQRRIGKVALCSLKKQKKGFFLGKKSIAKLSLAILALMIILIFLFHYTIPIKGSVDKIFNFTELNGYRLEIELEKQKFFTNELIKISGFFGLTDKTPIENQSLSLTLISSDSITNQIVSTDWNGTFSLSFNLNQGNYTIVASSGELETYLNFEVLEIPFNITLEKSVFKANETVSIFIQGETNKEFTLEIFGQEITENFTLTTDEKGFYIFNKTFPPGNYSARILSNEVSFEVLEEKEEIKLELISKEFYYLDENITLIVSGTPDQKFDLSVLKENLTVFSFLGQTNSSGLSEIYFKLFEKGNYSAILKYEEKEELTIFEVLERIENITEEILTRNITLTVVSLEQEKAEINKPVKWKKVLRVINPTEKDAEIEFNLELELPENSFNISVQEKESKAIKKLEGKSFKDKLKPKESKEYVLTYYTEAPQAYEEVLNKYRKIIRVNSSLHYENVLAYTEVEKSPRNSVRLYWLVNSERIDVTFNESFKVKLLDLDNDELIEKVEWLIPYLSEQVFEISITILNPYTYLRDGETWIVAFNTTGKADLIISSPNANWREMFADDENTFDEMEFLDIKCGNNSVKNSLQLIDELNNTYNYSRLTEKDSVKVKKFLIKDYSCEETGYFINRMFRAGYAVLEFEFAGQKAYAYDPTPCEVNISSCSDLNQANTYYCLNQSILDSSSTACINISANNITLDCLGNTIDGNDTSITYGINISRSSSQATNITVKNCIVTDWYYGIRLLKANNNTLINLTSEENMKSISVSESNYNLIKDVKVFCTNYCEDGISIYWSNYTIISDSEFFSLSRAGVYLLSSFNNTLINLTSKDSLYGINLEGSSNNTLMNSTLDYCFESGLSLSSSSFNTILNNKISNSLFYGITLDYSHSNILANNVIFSNGLANIYFYNSYDNKIYNNLFNNSNNFYFEGTLYNNYFNTTNQSGQRIYSPGNYIGGNYYTNYGQCQGSVIACEDITDPDNCNSQLDCYWDNGCQGDALNCSEIGTQAFCENQPGCYWNSSMVNVGYSDICQDYNRDGFCDYPYDALSEGACEIGINCSNNVDYLPLSDEYLPCDVFISSCSELTQPNTYYCLNQSILDSSSKSCINVSANNITLDCLGNTIDGTDASSTYGINISRSSSQATNITVKNCIVTDWSDGIYLHNSANNKLINITVNSSTNRAIFLDASSSNLLEDIKAYNNYRGLYIYYSSDNQVKDSIIQESSRHDFLIGADSDTSCNNYIYNITGSGGRPIKYFNYSVNLQNEVLSALILCNADFSNITNVTINGSPTIDNNALFVTRTENSRFVRIQSSDNLVGIYLFSSSNNQIIDSTLNYNNAWAGVFLENSNNNTVINSTLHNNMFGISMSSSSDNTIINSSIAFSFNADYHFYSGVCLGNNFTNTNFTAPRKIYFEAPSSNWFNYNNRTDIELWLKTRVSSAAAINRSLIKWTQQEIKWNENASTTITAYYEINGLYPNQEYKIYNGSQLVYTQNTTSTGNLTFNLTITTDIREITVNTTADLEPPLIQFVPPTPANNSIVQNNFVYVNTTITDASNTSAFIDWNYSLVGYWSFDWYNSSGVFDNSTYNNFGFFQGGLGIDNITTGQYGKGISLNGTDNCISVVSSFPALRGTKTITAWIKTFNSTATIFTVQDPGWATNGYGFYLYNYKPNFYVSNGTNRQAIASSITIPTNQFVFVAAIYDNETNSIIFYVNESKDGPYYFTIPNTWNITPTAPKIGGEDCTGNEYGLNGTIDEVRIWNRALTEDEIKASYNSGLYRLYRNFTNLSDGTYRYYAYTIDTAGNANKTETRTVTVDTKPPEWSQQFQSTNILGVGGKVNLSTYWIDKVGLDKAILSTNETGCGPTPCYNKTSISLSGTSGWSNFTWQNSSVPGNTVIAWRIYANDTLNNQNVTDIMTFEVKPTYLLVNWKEDSQINSNICNASSPCSIIPNSVFKASVEVTCYSEGEIEDCGIVKASVRYNESGVEPNKLINTTEDEPFYIPMKSSNPVTVAKVLDFSPGFGQMFGYGSCRNTFYDGSKFWIFFANRTSDRGGKTLYSYSFDGKNWNSPATLVERADDILIPCVWFNETTQTVYVSMTSFGYAENVYFIRGTINNTVINWGNLRTAVGGVKFRRGTFPTVDSSGYPWIGYSEYNGSVYRPWVVRASSQDGSTWSSPTLLSDEAGSGFMSPILLPLSNNKMYAIWYSYQDSAYKGKKYDGVSWESTPTIIDNSVIPPSSYQGHYATVVEDRIYFVFTGSDGRIYVRNWTESQGWGDRIVLDDNTTNDAKVTITSDSKGNLFVFWNRSDTIYFKKYSPFYGWDLKASTPFGTSFNIIKVLRSSQFVVDGKVGVAWLENVTSSSNSIPYPIRFSYIDVEPNPITCGILKKGETCQVSWAINATGLAESVWALDANFTSSVEGIPENDTDNAYVKISFCQQYISSCSDLNQANTYYCLNQSILDSSSTACINISANNITLDCLGNTIDGKGTSITYGINISRSSSQVTNITIKNCIVTDWYYGIYLRNANNNTFINNSANSNSQYGFYIYYYSNYNSFINNSANSNSFGFRLSSSSNFNSFINNSAISNSQYGFYIYSSSYNTFINNTITSYHNSTHKQQGLFIEGSSISHFYHNISESNLINDKPILYQDSIYNPCTNNTIFTNGSSYSYMGFVNCFNITIKDSSPSESILLAGTNNSTISNLNISYSQYPFYLFSSSYNTLSNNSANSNSYGFYIDYNSNYNTFLNNSANLNSYGIYLYSSSNNNITGGSFHSNTNYDYYLRSAGSTNNFTATNFTAPRKIYFYDSESWFNYNNRTDIELWLKTRVSAATIITRKLISWEKSLMIWNDTNSTGTEITANYNISGLNPNKYYLIYNNSVLTYTLQSDSSGSLSFTIYLSSEHEIKVEEDTQPPQYSFNSTNSTIAGSAVSHNLFWQDNIGLSHAIFSFDNCTGEFQNISEMSLSGTQAWTNFTVTINDTIGCTIRWKVYANDSNNNWNESEVFSYTTKHAFCDVFISSCSDLNQANTYYCLNQSILDSSSTACINISANNITLDCLGNTIDGNDTSSTYGINISRSSSQVTNITIKNCIVTDWTYGIYLYQSQNNTLTNNTANSNYYGFYIYYYSNYNTLTNNTAISNSDTGIFLSSSSNFNTLTNNTANSNSYGILLSSNSNFNTLTNNTANSNSYGIYLFSSSSNTLFNNQITSYHNSTHKQQGLYIEGTSISHFYHNISESNLINGKPVLYQDSIYRQCTNNTIFTNGSSYSYIGFVNCFNITVKDSSPSEGILLAGTDNSTISNLNISFSRYPFYLFSSKYNIIANNTANSNYYGIYLFSSSNNIIANNTANSNSYGISLFSSSNFNTLTNNTANSNSYGISLYSSSNNIIANNTANSNSDIGIRLFSSSNNIIANNTANSNYYGIYLSSSSNFNTLTNNTANSNSYGIRLFSSSNNSITGGSFHSNTNYDYHLYSAGSTNNFTQTNFTSARKIYFSDSSSWFNYNNRTDIELWLKTSVSSSATITRTLNKWSKINISWNDSSSSAITAYYNLTGLLPNTLYRIYNFSKNFINITTDSKGALTFTITLNSTSREIRTEAYVEGCDILIDNSSLPYTITESNKVYCLAENIGWPGVNGITFASGVQNSTLDCLGFSITSNKTTNTYGIYLTGSNTKNNTIKNCIISNFYHGFSLLSSSFNILTNNILTNNSMVGIYMCDSDSNTISNNTINLSTYGMRFNPGSYNKVFDNYITSNNHGIEIEDSSEGNNFTNNLINFNYFGFYALSFYYNNVTGGSILSTGYDYYFFSPLGPETNYFRNTNFTAPRKISFTVTPTWFNYNNRTDIELWLKTSVSSSATITRNLFSWTKALIKWQEQSDQTITAYYNLTGLYPNTEYKIYNGSELVYTQYTDSQGNLEFNLTITTTSRNITVQYQNCEEVIYYLPYTINKNNTYYCLESDKYIADQTAITFASGVQNSTLDCLGYNLDSNDVYTNYGVYLTSNTKNNTIKNCKITDFGYGIYLEYSSNNTLINNTASSNIDEGFRLYNSSNNTLINNTASSNIQGFYLYYNSNYNTLINNTANLNSDEDFYLEISHYNILLNNTAASNCDRGFYLKYSSYNTLSNNIAKSNYHGFFLYFSSNNTLINNTAISNIFYGFLLGYSSNNTITGGSIALSSIAEYYLYSAGSTNNFTNTNFTAPRKIYFEDSYSWFNYNNRTDIELWLKTSVSSSATITRKLISWEKSLMIWNDTNTSGTEITANYNITGLNPNKYYLVYNNSVLTYTLQADSSGNLPSFTIYLLGEREIKVQEEEAPQYSNNKTFPTSPTTYDQGKAYQFNITCTDNSGISNAWLTFNGTIYQMSNQSNEYYITLTDLPAGNYYYNFTCNDTYGITNTTDTLLYKIEKAKPVLTISNATYSVNTSGLVGYWRFEEGSGSLTKDSSGYGNDGTLYNNPTWQEGRFGNSVNLNGINQYINLSNSSSLNTLSFTLSLWFKLNSDPNCDGLNNWRSFARKGSTAGTSTGWDIVLEDDRSLQFDIGNGTSWQNRLRTSAGIVPVNEWVHLVFVYDSVKNTTKIYKNGTLVASRSIIGLMVPNTQPILLSGGTNSSSCPYQSGYVNGSFDEVKIYNRTLNEDEIKMLYQNEVTYKTQTNFSCFSNTQQVTPSLYRNTTLVSNPDVQNLTAGYYYYLCNASETQNYTQSAILAPLKVSPGFISLTFSPELTKGIFYTNLTGSSLNIQFNVDINAWNNATWNYNATDKKTEYWIRNDGTYEVDICQKASSNMLCYDECANPSYEIYIGNVSWSNSTLNDEANPSFSTLYPLTLDYSENKSAYSLAPGQYLYLRFWLFVPSYVPSGKYNTSIIFKAVEAGNSC